MRLGIFVFFIVTLQFKISFGPLEFKLFLFWKGITFLISFCYFFSLL